MEARDFIEEELRQTDTWLSGFVNGVVQMNLMQAERIIRKRSMLIKKLQKIQLKEFRRG